LILLKTSKVNNIWEQDGIAGFNSHFTGRELINYSNLLPLKAIGYYSGIQDNKFISLLEIHEIKINPNSSNDLLLGFKFLKKINILSSIFENEISKYDNRYLYHLEDELINNIFNNMEINIMGEISTNSKCDDLEKLCSDILIIINDYRSEDGIKLNKDKIKNWVNQFDQNDKIFILQELFHILDERYITKKQAENFLIGIVKKLCEDFKYEDERSLLKDCYFIDHQPEGKSQKELLKLFDKLITREFDISISECGKSNQKYFIYLDDFLCTGDTLFKGLAKPVTGWLYKIFNGQTLLKKLMDGESKLVFTYFVIHDLNYHKFIYRLRANIKEDISSRITCYSYLEIKNNYKDLGSKLDFLFPIRNGQSKRVIDFFNELNVSSDSGVFRDSDYPKDETFFSSKENRIRLENILLNKGLELYDLAGSGRSPRMRPLGYGLTSHKNFGFGTLCFSWRNVPFNVPMVFWYSHHNWIPLFDRKFVTY